MKSLKSILDMEILQVDWKNIVSINTDRLNGTKNTHESEEMNFLFI